MTGFCYDGECRPQSFSSHFDEVGCDTVSASLSSTGVSVCASGCNWMDLFRIPDKLMWVTLSLSGSTSIALSSSCVSDLDGSAAMVWFVWL